MDSMYVTYEHYKTKERNKRRYILYHCVFILYATCLSHVPALFSPCRTVQPCSSISQAHATGSA